MGEHAALTAEQFKIGREAQDELAAESHAKLAAAYDRGFFDDLVTPYAGLTRDQNLRADSSAEKLAKLKPVFGDTMTAGNSTPLSDGAAVVLLSTDEWAKERNLPVLAHLTHAQTAAVDYVDGDDGLLMAPVYAVPKLLEKAGLTLQDFDFYEIHEAFASQVLATLKAWKRQRPRDDRPLEAQRRRRLARRRPPLCRHRRPHPRHAREAHQRAWRGPRADLDLRGRRPGRRRDRRRLR